MRRITTLMAAVLAIAALAACGETKEPTTPPPATSAAAASTDAAAATSAAAAATDAAATDAASAPATSAAAPVDATFTYESQNTIVTDLDPRSSYSNEVIAMNNIYEQLTRYDSTTKTVGPLLATAWESSADGKTWTFTLREGATFHSGNPVTSADVKASVEATKELAAGAAYEWDSVESVEAPDPQTVVFTLKYAAPLDLISSSAYAAYVFDTKAWGSEDPVKWFNSGKDAGSGPYTIAEWNKGQENELRLEAYADYWGGWDGAHYTRALFKYVPEPTTRAQLLQSGEATFADRLSPQLFEQLQSDANLATSESGSFQNLIAFMNTADGPLADPKLRKAVALAIDYDGIVAALKGAVVPASGFIPEGLLGYTPDLKATRDVAAAKALVEEAGAKGTQLVMTHANGDSDQQLVATILKSNMKEIGLDLKVEASEFQAQWDRGKSKDASKRQDIFVMYWYPDYADPFSWFVNLFRSADPPFFNMTYLADADVDATIDGLQSLTATSKEQAQTAYVDLQRTLLDDAVAVPLYVTNFQRVIPKSVGGYVDNPAYTNVVFIHELTPGA